MERNLFEELMQGIEDIRRFRNGEIELMVSHVDPKRPWRYKRGKTKVSGLKKPNPKR